MTWFKDHSTITATISVAAVLAAASGGYLAGRSTGEDLEAAREKGEAAGRVAGERQGMKRGHREGEQAGFRTGYEAAYRKKFEEVGLEPPDDVEVPTR